MPANTAQRSPLPRHVENFRAAAQQFADTLRAAFANPLIQGEPEIQIAQPVRDLLASVLNNNVQTSLEVHSRQVRGIHDIGVSVDGLLCGFVELKAPGRGAKTSAFKGHDKEQWERFRELPNILYTDACEWALYRTGAQTAADGKPILVRLDGIIENGAAALDDATVLALHELLTDFLSWNPVVPDSPRKLAGVLAPLCRILREEVQSAVERENSALKTLCAEIRQYLFPHTDNKQFADIYAQTLTYALLLARILDDTAPLDAARAARQLDSGHGLLAQTLRILTQPEARAEIETSVSILERVIGAIDPSKLAKRGDPWLYFYEDFLAAYDPKLRRQHGVYYTPQEVIHCQIALVSELLEKQFNKRLTFADAGVTFLDSSAGTGAYPLAAIESALEKVEAQLGPGAVPAHAARCAENINAFEILVGPYAVAHLRLTKLLADAGATLPANGLNVLLTDTLESPFADPPKTNLFGKKLTDEQIRATRVKAEKPVFVCMGNPPYFRETSEEGEERTRGRWVRFGDMEKLKVKAPDKIGHISGKWVRFANKKNENEENQVYLPPIFADFMEGTPGVHAKNLYNLYVYFWRWTLWKMFENGYAERRGIISFITASSYLRGPGFAGMRRKMREAFDELWIIDLEGDGLGARKTENVFAIQTPVCIATGVRYAVEKRNALAKVRYAKLTGAREEKLAALKQITRLADVAWEDCFDEADKPFLPRQAGDYFSWPLLTDLWPWQQSGAQWKRTWPIAETREVLNQRWTMLVNAQAEKRAELLKESRDRKIDKVYKSLLSPDEELPAISTLPRNASCITPVRYSFRSFDNRWVIPDGRIGDFLRPALWRAHSERQVYFTSLLSKVLSAGPAVTAAVTPPDLDYFCNRGGKDVIPLWRDAAATQPNLPAGLLEKLSVVLKRPVTAEDFFAYTYAVLSAPAYVETFSEELTIPGPRLPVTRNAKLFTRAVALGRRLLFLHTYGERFVPDGGQRGQLPAGKTKCTKSVPTNNAGYPNKFSWTPGPTPDSGVLRVGEGEFAPVSRAVWEFSVSGYEVVKSWLGYRMKERKGKKSSPLDDIRPAAWTAELTRELLELLWVLDATIAAHPAANTLLAEILSAPLFAADDFPAPAEAERAELARDKTGGAAQRELGLE